jgi:hypothetical protein
MSILFITHPYPNYVPDLLLHGLRKLMGSDVVDYPKKDCLYQGILGLGVCPEDQLCPGWFPPDRGDIDREDIWKKVNDKHFKYIICDCRSFPALLGNLTDWPPGLVVVDGEDSPAKVPPGRYVICRRETDGSDFSIPSPMAIPEEVLDWITTYDNSPKQYTIGFFGCADGGYRKRTVETIAQICPDTLFQTSAVPSDENPYPEGRMSRDDYYRSLQKCRMVLSLPGAGHDTFRFWENAACNAVHVSFKMPLFIPDDFVEGKHILRFSNIDELKKIVEQVLEKKVQLDEMIFEARSHLVNFHLTTRRAQYFLDRIGYAFT